MLAFLPFFAFAVVDRLVGSLEGLLAGAAVSAALLIRDVLVSRRTAKILEVGTFLLFGGLALYTFLVRPDWSIVDVRLRVDAGLLLIVLISMMVHRPFTLQYAREQAGREWWDQPAFIRTNYVITAVWALAFLVMVIADLVMLYEPALSPRIGVVVTILAIVGAVKFTAWYPKRASKPR